MSRAVTDGGGGGRHGARGVGMGVGAELGRWKAVSVSGMQAVGGAAAAAGTGRGTPDGCR